MSIKTKVRLLYLGIFLGVLFIMFGTSFMSDAASWHVMRIFLPAFVLIFGGLSSLIRCPNCGKPVFMRDGGMVAPWPERDCGRCGTKLIGQRGEETRDLRSPKV